MTSAAAPGFDNRAKTYDDHASVQRAAADWLAEWLPARMDEPVLEFGAGTGLLTRHLAGRAVDITATDISPRMVEAGSSAVTAARWLVADADKPPSGRQYRTLASSSMLQWIPDPVRTFRRWHAISAPGATLLAACFIRGTLEQFYELCPDASPFRWRDAHEWLDVLNESGWRVRRHETKTFHLRHASAAQMLRAIHNVGAIVPGRFGPARLRKTLCAHDRTHGGPSGIATPFVCLRVEAQKT